MLDMVLHRQSNWIEFYSVSSSVFWDLGSFSKASQDCHKRGFLEIKDLMLNYYSVQQGVYALSSLRNPLRNPAKRLLERLTSSITSFDPSKFLRLFLKHLLTIEFEVNPKMAKKAVTKTLQVMRFLKGPIFLFPFKMRHFEIHVKLTVSVPAFWAILDAPS